ncbi:hypothetical protein [Paenibacillus contaminans]|uniref:Glycosyltransferase 2-like domain-containing protein n=1 Tax=Paenibacillus contaminans TaxID=450362 RepID=A0A329MBU5_9BACL|nr:hypothetical protein [Paenibacillus contaminans]RAV17390.1 hypothetical protein DQG23_27500 [Paenibacillus contaminans]
MIVGLLLFFGLYGLSAVLVHVWYALDQNKKRRRTIRFILITRNNEQHMEWYLRSLRFFSRWRGCHVAIAVFDDGSTDDTLHIARQYGRKRDYIDIYERVDDIDNYMDDWQGERLIVLRLHLLTPYRRLAVLQW